MSTNMIKVAIKVRPLIPREKRTCIEEQWTVTQNSIVSLHPIQTPAYHFDHVFGKESRNRDVFEKIAHPIVRQSLEGFNGTIFAYGQTSSGKTHTMLGNEEDPGITVLAVRQLFEENESDRTFMIRVGYIEIYNEKVYDLLTERKLVTINQNGENDIKLTNKEVLVKDGDTILNILALGNKLRKAALTNMNEASSRSHAIFRIIIESEDATGNGPVRVSYLNLVDLAGSEKANDAGTSGTRLKEGNDINKSLLHLGIAIRALSEGKKFVDVRSSKLTRILQASLGGNANTAIICNITPAAIEETASTLGFANQAKTVKNEAKCNEVFTPEEAFMKQMQAEVVRLKTELQNSNENEKKLRAEIAQKEAIFLIGRNMRVKADRRKTWHHTTSENVQHVSMIPRCHITTSMSATKANSSSNSPSLDCTPAPDTPIELRLQPSVTPSPNQAGLKYRLGRIEKEYSDLQVFTALESRFDLHSNAAEKDSYIEKLEKDLKFAREEVEKYRQQSFGKLVNGISNGNGMTDSVTNDEPSVDSAVLSELTAAKDHNNELMQQLAQLRSVHEKEKEILDEKIRAAKHAQEKAEILQAEGDITLAQYKKQTNQRINELISEVETLKAHTNPKSVDLNISKMPIKVEPANSYEITELKYDLDQLQSEQERNKKIIEGLETELKSLTEERNVLRLQHSESSLHNSKIIKDLESQLAVVTEERNILQGSRSVKSESNSKVIQDLELQVKAMTEERIVLQSEHTQLAVRHNEIVKALESQLEAMTEERKNNKIIQDLECQLEAITEEKNVLQSEHSDLSTQIMDYIEDLDEMKSKLDSMGSLQVKLADLQKLYDCSCAEVDKLQTIVDENLQVIEKTEEECKTFKASLLESYDKIKISMEETESLKAKKSSLSLEVSNLKNSLNTQSGEVDILREKVQELQQQNAMLSADKKDEVSQSDQVEKLQKQHRAEIAEIEENVKKLQLNVDQLQSELNMKSNLLSASEDAFNSNIAVLKADLQEKQELIDKYQATITKLDSELNEMVEQSNGLINSLEKDLREKQRQVDDLEAIISDLKSNNSQKSQSELHQLKAELVEKKQLINDHDAMTTDLSAKFEKQLEKLKEELEAKQQLIDNHDDLSAKFQSELHQLKAELVEKKQLINDHDAMTTDLSAKFEKQLEKLKEELEAKQQLIDNHDDLSAKFQSELHQLKAELVEKKQLINDHDAMTTDLSAKFEKQLEKLKEELEAKQQLIDNHDDLSAKFQSELHELKAELVEKKQLINDHDAMTTDLSAKFEKQLEKLKEELEAKQQLIDNHDDLSAKFQSELHQLKAELVEKKQLINDHDAMTTDLSAKFEKQLEKLKEELEAKQQLIDNHDDLSAKFQSELHQLKAELVEKKQLINDHDAMTTDLSAKFEKQLEKLKQELEAKQQLIDDHDDLNAKVENQLFELKAELEKKQQLIDNHDRMKSDLNGKFHNQIIELKAELQLKQNQVDENDQLISKLQSELTEKENNALSARNVIANLESQLRVDELGDQKRSPSKGTKPNLVVDRKAKRYSQHDESRLLDYTIEFSSVATQTDPSDENCSCESMNLKIAELKRQVAVKTAVVNTQRLEMENHPLIGENNDLKRALHDKEAELKLLNMDVDHYKRKWEQEKKCRQCSCLSKVMECKAVQVDYFDDVGKQNGVTNGQNGNCENIYVQEFHQYCQRILPSKYQMAKEKIKKLEKSEAELKNERVDIIKKSNFYKKLALSRREDIKTLQAKLGIVDKPAADVGPMHAPRDPPA